MSSVQYIKETLSKPALERVRVRFFNDKIKYCDGQSEDEIKGVDIAVRCREKHGRSWSDRDFTIYREEDQSNYGLLSNVMVILTMLEKMHDQGGRDRSKAIMVLLDDK